MKIMEQLEYPLPLLKVESEKIVIEATDTARGRIQVSNSGGGLLEGKIVSNNPALSFVTERFSGNAVRLDYEVSVRGYKPGDLIRANAVIMSNGGEKTISFLIKALSRVLETPDGQTITGLKDFLGYAKKFPENARRVFYTKTFRGWLEESGYEYLEIFDFIIQDANAERAMENFFILNKQKNRPTVMLTQNLITCELDPVDMKAITGTFEIKKNGWGYVELPVNIIGTTPWLTIRPGIIGGSAFGTTDTAEVSYTINPALMNVKIDKATVNIADQCKIDFHVRIKPLFECFVRKESYSFEDTGALVVVNNSKSDVLFEINTNENCVKFEGRRYLVGTSAEIPFKVKLNGIQSAQLTIRRQPYITVEIYIRSSFDKIKFKKTIKISIGDSERL